MNLYSDIDECTTSNGGCQHVCNNNNGSHQCLCNDGYMPGADEYSCEGKVIDFKYQCVSYTLHS